jgi:hypothetical protein
MLYPFLVADWREVQYAIADAAAAIAVIKANLPLDHRERYWKASEDLINARRSGWQQVITEYIEAASALAEDAAGRLRDMAGSRVPARIRIWNRVRLRQAPK